MNKLLQYHLDRDWVLVRSTPRFWYLRNKKKPPQLKGQGEWPMRLVKPWYEPIYLYFRAHFDSYPEWLRLFVYVHILGEKSQKRARITYDS